MDTGKAVLHTRSIGGNRGRTVREGAVEGERGRTHNMEDIIVKMICNRGCER